MNVVVSCGEICDFIGTIAKRGIGREWGAVFGNAVAIGRCAACDVKGDGAVIGSVTGDIGACGGCCECRGHSDGEVVGLVGAVGVEGNAMASSNSILIVVCTSKLNAVSVSTFFKRNVI